MCRLSAGAQREGHNPTLQRHTQARPPLEPARNFYDILTAKDRWTTTPVFGKFLHAAAR